MIIVRINNKLDGDYLVLINGIELCPTTLQSLKDLENFEGIPIKHVISPGDWHYLFLPQYLKFFPNATIHIPPGRIQRKEPIISKQYKLIDMKDPLPFLRPTLLTIPFQGLQQGPADGFHWFDHRNEFLFYHKDSKSLFAGDTLFFEKCGVGNPSGEINFNPQGLYMVANVTEALGTAQLVLNLDFNSFINIHGMLGSMIPFDGAKPLVKNAFSIFNSQTIHKAF